MTGTGQPLPVLWRGWQHLHPAQQLQHGSNPCITASHAQTGVTGCSIQAADLVQLQKQQWGNTEP